MLKEIFKPSKLSIFLAVIIMALLVFLPIAEHPIFCNIAPCGPVFDSMVSLLAGFIYPLPALLVSALLSYAVASFVIFAVRKKK